MITPSFYLALVMFTRQKEQLIGITHETAVQEDLYDALTGATKEQGAKRALSERVNSELSALIKQSKQLPRTAENIGKHRKIGRDIELAVNVLEQIANG